MKIIFVCTGNTCRSPLAESIGMQLLPSENITSRGLFTVNGQSISKESLKLIHQFNLPEPTCTQQFSIDDLEADLILTMTTYHKDLLMAQYGQNLNVYTLSDYVNDNEEVQDPFGGSSEVYEQTYHQIYELIEKLKLKHT
ncbi:low molecular weight protein arginine phosphatase [Staphylococcus saccharolyticus]|uniref:low molecular weight protein arginine phosphatase n=1 Tax=Staphylococcus saccharolyticus TaxID=33028 RepID=UPI0032DF7D86